MCLTDSVTATATTVMTETGMEHLVVIIVVVIGSVLIIAGATGAAVACIIIRNGGKVHKLNSNKSKR